MTASFKKLNVLFTPQMTSKSCSLECHCTSTVLQERKKKKKPSKMQSLLLCRCVSVEGIFSHSPSGLQKSSSLSTTDDMDRNGDGAQQKKGMRKLFLKPRENICLRKKRKKWDPISFKLTSQHPISCRTQGAKEEQDLALPHWA